MASASSSQHRCVFVGNIPYDATEEQLIDICREVGPVVSFRLVIDRDTGKPKGYGFCEYKDEETALSARRNLQGYEINGRQLRVDFAENDKNSDKNREQGRGGPGLVANVDPHKQVGGSALTGESSQHQPIGLHIAMTAATVMAETLGGAQTGMQGNQNGLQGQSAVANDPLTFHLAKMSRSQLNEVISELKVMATQNREAARQLLLARPQLPKAIFQAQIMLGMVTPQMLQMPNIRQPLGQPPPPMLQDTKQVNPVPVHTGPGLPSLAPRPHPTLVPKMQEGPASALLQPSLAQNQFSATIRPLVQSQTQIPQQATLFGQSGVPPIRPAHLSVRPQILGASSPSVNQQTQSSFLQHPGKVGIVNICHNSPMVVPNVDKHASLLARPSPPDNSFRRKGSDKIVQEEETIDGLMQMHAAQSGLPTSSGIPDAASKDTDRPRVPDDAPQVHSSNTFMNLQTNTVHDSKEPISRPSMLLRLDDGRDATTSGASQMVPIGSVPPNPLSKSKELHYSERQVSQQQQQQLTPDVESGLLQQVLNLTPEQLSSLPPEQQQEVIQLQQALRRDQLQPL